MGGGIAFRAGDCDLADEQVRIHRHVSTLVAEGAAACVLLAMVPKTAPLVIFTDSANIMFAMQHCSRREAWRDFSGHADAELLEELARLQAGRTALTVWVKIKSHTSVELNERADALAAEAPFAEDGRSKLFTEQEDVNLIQFYKIGAPEPQQVSNQELKDHFISLRCRQVLKKQSGTIKRLLAEGVGREYLPTVLWSTGPYSVKDKMVKRMLQCITHTFPTQSRLFQMNISADSRCRFCSHKCEDLTHWQSMCSHFSDAQTQVHNDIWSAVSEAICSCLSVDWEFFKEVPVSRIFDGIRAFPELTRRQPDGIFYRPKDVKYVLVDFTRGYGSLLTELRAQEDTKRQKYADLMQALQIQHMVEFFPLVCGYGGAVAVDTWRALMDTLELEAKDQEKVLKTAIRAICVGFSTMVDIRHGSLHAARQSSHASGRRHI